MKKYSRALNQNAPGPQTPHSELPIPHSALAIPHSKKPATCNLQPATQYSLRKDLGFWHLTFASQTAIFKHEQGALYVAYLLLNPPTEPIHALELTMRIARPSSTS